MNADGTAARTVGGPVAIEGDPVWSPDGESVVVAVNDGGRPRLHRIALDTGLKTRLIDDYSVDPAWAPTGDFLVYSGADIGTTFPVNAITADGRPRPIRALRLSRGARRYRFVPGEMTLIVLRGDIEHKDLWAINLATNAERQLTAFGPDVVIGDFDISSDGREIVFDRMQEDSDIALIERRLQ